MTNYTMAAFAVLLTSLSLFSCGEPLIEPETPEQEQQLDQMTKMIYNAHAHLARASDVPADAVVPASTLEFGAPVVPWRDAKVLAPAAMRLGAQETLDVEMDTDANRNPVVEFSVLMPEGVQLVTEQVKVRLVNHSLVDANGKAVEIATNSNALGTYTHSGGDYDEQNNYIAVILHGFNSSFTVQNMDALTPPLQGQATLAIEYPSAYETALLSADQIGKTQSIGGGTVTLKSMRDNVVYLQREGIDYEAIGVTPLSEDEQPLGIDSRKTGGIGMSVSKGEIHDKTYEIFEADPDIGLEAFAKKINNFLMRTIQNPEAEPAPPNHLVINYGVPAPKVMLYAPKSTETIEVTATAQGLKPLQYN